MKSLRFMQLILPSLALAGCSMVPTYVRPDAPVPPALPQGPAYPQLGTGDTAVDTLGWRDFFTDAKLTAIIAQAMEQNRDLRATVANVERARALYRVQRAGQFPSIAAGPSAGVSQIGGGPTVQSYGVSGSLSAFEIDLFGRRAALSQAQFELYLASDEGRKSAQIALVAETATAWLTYAAFADSLTIARETLHSREQTLDLNQKRERQGIGTALDVAQAQTQVDGARADVANYTTALAQSRNALELLAGSPIRADLLPTTLGAGDQTLSSLPVGLTSTILLRRPDVLAAEHQLKSTNANVGAARAAMFPTISLTGVIGLASDGLSTLFSDGAFHWNASGAATQTIFDGGAKGAALDAAKAERKSALALYEGTIQSAFRDVADALARRGTIDDQLTAQESLAANAAKAARITEARFSAGIASSLEPLDAQRTAYAARQALVSVRLERATNMVSLYRALGGGLRP
jgi:multidrug efflux system outer membrane protein